MEWLLPFIGLAIGLIVITVFVSYASKSYRLKRNYKTYKDLNGKSWDEGKNPVSTKGFDEISSIKTATPRFHSFLKAIWLISVLILIFRNIDDIKEFTINLFSSISLSDTVGWILIGVVSATIIFVLIRGVLSMVRSNSVSSDNMQTEAKTNRNSNYIKAFIFILIVLSQAGLWNLAYDTGYEDGYDRGFQDGDYWGHRRGYDEGFYEGKNEGYKEGYDEGYDEGKDLCGL